MKYNVNALCVRVQNGEFWIIWHVSAAREERGVSGRCGSDSGRRNVSVPKRISPAISAQRKTRKQHYVSRSGSKREPIIVVLHSTDADYSKCIYVNGLLFSSAASRKGWSGKCRVFSLRLIQQECVIMLATHGLILWATVTARLVLTGEGQVSRLNQVHDMYMYQLWWVSYAPTGAKNLKGCSVVFCQCIALNFTVAPDHIKYKRVGILFIPKGSVSISNYTYTHECVIYFCLYSKARATALVGTD